MDEKLLISRPIIENGDYGLSDESQRSIALYLFETYIFFKEVNIFGTFEEIRNGCNQLPIEKRKTFLQETIKYMDEIISHAGKLSRF